MATPSGAGEGVEEVHLTTTLFDEIHGVRIEMTVRIKAHSKDAGILL